MRTKLTILGMLLLLSAIACSSGDNTPFAARSLDEAMPEPPSPRKAQSSQPQDMERKLIEQGNIRFETDNIDTTRKHVLNAVKKYEGYISSDQEYKRTGQISNTLVIRVPANNFDDLLADATKGVDKLDQKEITVKDVTEQFVDIQARLKTKKELEARYKELLKKATKVAEILDIEKEMSQLRADIESVEGRLKYLNNQVSFSTLTMTFYKELPNGATSENVFVESFKEGWHNLVSFFVYLISYWPFILILLALIVGISIRRKKI